MPLKQSSVPFLSIFDSHHKMERLGITLTSFVLVFSLIFAHGYRCQRLADVIDPTSQQIVRTEKAVWSLSQKKINVNNVYKNKDNTKLLIVMQMDDTEAVSTNANDYRVFLLPLGTSTIEHRITGSYYVFGNTGYSAICLMDSQGFENTYANLVVRNSAALSSSEHVDYNPELDSDKSSFDVYNQIQIQLGFADPTIIEANCLDSTDVSVENVYAECVVTNEVDAVKASLNESLVEINQKLAQLNEYVRRLTSYGFEVKLPNCIAGDRIVTDVTLTESNPIQFDASMLLSNDIIQSEYTNILGEGTEGETQTYVAGDKVYMKTDFVFPGGCQYNYQDVDIAEQYTTQITPAGMAYSNWKQYLKSEANEYSSVNWCPVSTDGWILNGSEYVYDTNVSKQSAEWSYNADIDAYNKILLEVVELKRKYQTEELFQLLDIDAAAQTINSVVSINNSSDVIVHIKSGDNN